MKPLHALLLVVAIAALVVGIVWVLGDEGTDGPRDLHADMPAPPSPAEQRAMARGTETPRGGVFGGRVVDDTGAPLRGAHVLLAAYNDGSHLAEMGPSPMALDPATDQLPTVGDHSIGGREATTDAEGRFRIPADTRALVTHVAAWHHAHFLNVVAVKGPTDEIVIVLQPAGRVRGQVLDDETGDPVPNALVDIFLQQPVAPIDPSLPHGSTMPKDPQRYRAPSHIARLGKFIAKELGERIWSVPFQGRESLRLRTDRDGRFALGPFGPGVQLEFLITHNDYKWIDFDTSDGAHAPRRTVVGAGETVERTFRMKKGLRISGVLMDTKGTPIEGARLEFESITAYHRHWMDAAGQDRKTSTDAQGRFTIGGLAFGSHNLRIVHASFGVHYEHGIEAGTEDKEIVVHRPGRVVARVVGLEQRPVGGRVHVNLQPLGPTPEKQDRMRRRRVLLTRANEVVLDGVKPGPYELWVEVADKSSLPVVIEVAEGVPAMPDIELGGGGRLEVRVLDLLDRVVDPATVRIVRLDPTHGERTMGRFISRAGWVVAENLVPGRYRLEASAPGHQGARSDPVEVVDGARTDVGVLRLKGFAFLRIASIATEEGRTPRDGITVEWKVAGDEGAWRPLRTRGAVQGDIAVPAGKVEIRARTSKGKAFEATVETRSGETHPVAIVLR